MGVIAALSSIAFVTVVVVFAQVFTAPGKLKVDDAQAEMAQLLEAGGRDAMLMYLRSGLQSPEMAIADACLFGSVVIAYPPPRDVDVAVRFAQVPHSKVVRADRFLVAFAGEFKERFNTPLHLQRFLHNEVARIAKFNSEAQPRQSLLGVLWED